MAETDGTLLVELKNQKPIELRDLTLSFLALGQAYEDYVVSAGHEHIAGNVRLYVKELRSGSVIAELMAKADQAHAFLDNIETIAGFVTSLNDVLQFFLGLSPPKAQPPTKKLAEQLNQIIEPVAKDGGAQFIIQVNGDFHLDKRVMINSRDANAVQNQIGRFLSASLPKDEILRGEVLYLRRVSDETKGNIGDKGTIERLSPKLVPLRFDSHAAKQIILDQPYPFRVAFVVDVDVRTVSGRPALYRILDVTDVIPRPDVDGDEVPEDGEPSA
jgi:hypothetical protein